MYVLAAFQFFILSGCLRNENDSIIHTVFIDANARYQTIAGFGASDCWTVNYVGKNWNESEKETLSRWLFSRNYKDDGSPEGIGLSMWRFNIGAGTYEQGDDSGIQDMSRRAECFLADIYRGGIYDWSKQAGQQYFLRKARDYGVENVVLFSNSPPVAFTKNGRGYADKGGQTNLRDNAFTDFAVYMADVAAHFRAEGIPVTYLSPVNEPQYNWDEPNQEGSPWSNNDISRLVKEMDRAILDKSPGVKILISEAGTWDALYAENGRASNQVWAFFDPESPDYVGNIPSAPRILGAHSLWSHGTDRVLRGARNTARIAAGNYNLGLFQTEWSMLQGGEGLPEDLGAADYFDMALFMAKIIHSDMVYANAASWSFWTSMDMDRWNHKNRFLLIMLDPASDGPYHPIVDTGAVEARSTLWVLGNYSFFIKPGYTRIALNGASRLDSLMGSAYISPDCKRLVTVYCNMRRSEQYAEPVFSNLEMPPETVNFYITDANRNLEKLGSSLKYRPKNKIVIPARSVLTVVYDMVADTGKTESPAVIDRVLPGDPESEYAHQFKGNNARSGYHNHALWRDAYGDTNSFYQYTLNTGGYGNLILQVRYWGNESGERAFDIYIDDEHLSDENIVGKWSVVDFVKAEYPVPAGMAEGKDRITVKFLAKDNNVAGGIYGLCLLNK